MDHSRRPSTTAFSDDFNEFDLLLEEDEPAAAAAAPSRTGRIPAIRRGSAGSSDDGGSSPARPRIRITPDWNRVAAVLLVVAVVLFLLYFIVTSIMSSRREGAYKDYFGEAREIAAQSTQQGVELSAILASPTGGTTAQRIAEIEGLSGRVGKLASSAEEIDVPEQLASSNEWFVTSLRYRANGVQAVQRSLAASIDSKDQAASAQAVSSALARLVASDVLWADSFAVEARSTLSEDDIEGVRVPDSVFAKDLDGYGPKALMSTMDRLQSSGTASTDGAVTTTCAEGKICGGEVGAPTITPSGQTLTAGGVTEVKGGENISFEVPFTNQGEVQLSEVPVKITLTGEEADPITLTGVIEVVEPGEVASAQIALDVAPNFGETLDYTVLVGPIAGEKTADNNRTSGQILFELP